MSEPAKPAWVMRRSWIGRRPLARVAVAALAGLAAACAETGPTALTAGPPPCEPFTMPITVGGQPEQATGEACPQPDGSWLVTENVPGLPPQVYVVPPYPDDMAAEYAYDPWLYAPFWWGGGGFVVFAHFHHHDHDHHMGGMHPPAPPPGHAPGHR